MNTPVQKIHASTQKFTEIQDIFDTVVILNGGNACLVIEVTASNFALLSRQEQDMKIFSYASLLNSLTFPIQILIRNEKVDITSYLKSLEEAEKNTQNSLLRKNIGFYRNFIKEMILVNTVLNKRFYIVLNFSSLEAGPTGVSLTDKVNFARVAKKMLESKADSLLPELQKISSSSRVLEKDELVKLFYEIFNHEAVDATQVAADIKVPIITSH